VSSSTLLKPTSIREANIMKMEIHIDNANFFQTGIMYQGYGYRPDYRKLPFALGERVAQDMGQSAIIIERPVIYCSYPDNYDRIDDSVSQEKTAYMFSLEVRYRYQVRRFPSNFRGNRIVKRHWPEGFTPSEKGVDVAMATGMISSAHRDDSPEVFVIVSGDGDFVPAIDELHDAGKVIVLVSSKKSCSSTLLGKADHVILLDNLWGDLNYKSSRFQTDRQAMSFTKEWPARLDLN